MPLLGTYPFTDEMVMGIACVTFNLSLRKGGYSGHLQWCIMRKSLTAWTNLYGAGILVMGDTIYSQDRKKFTETTFPT